MPLEWRHLVCISMAAVLPASLCAQDTAAAMLQSEGIGVLVNHSAVPASTALFVKDLIETPKSVPARLDVAGSTADIIGETMVEFDGDELLLDHGSLSVHTARGLRVRVGCLTVTPIKPDEWTQFEIVDRDGKVTVRAAQNDVYIDARSKKLQQIKQPEHSNRDLVRQGEQKSRDEKCGGAYLNGPTAMPGIGAALNSPWAIGAGMVAVGTIACLGLLCHGDDPISPAYP
jgi:hypothetical protein